MPVAIGTDTAHRGNTRRVPMATRSNAELIDIQTAVNCH